jgi:hypothetical protein
MQKILSGDTILFYFWRRFKEKHTPSKHEQADY